MGDIGMTIKGKNFVLLTLLWIWPSLIQARDCGEKLLEANLSVKDSLAIISENFTIPRESYLGFKKLEKITLNKDQALRLHKLITKYKTSHEDMLSVFRSVVELFDTHRIEEIIHIIEMAASENLKPEKLAEVLSRIQKELPLIKKQLGFAETRSPFDLSEAKLHEAMLLFNVMGQREGTLTMTDFQEEIDFIVAELSPNGAWDVLSILETSLSFGESVESIVAKILEIQESFILEKRAVGFSPKPENTYTITADVSDSLAILEILDEGDMSLEQLFVEFEEYKELTEAPSMSHFVMQTDQQLQQKLRKMRQKAEEELRRISQLN